MSRLSILVLLVLIRTAHASPHEVRIIGILQMDKAGALQVVLYPRTPNQKSLKVGYPTDSREIVMWTGRMPSLIDQYVILKGQLDEKRNLLHAHSVRGTTPDLLSAGGGTGIFAEP